jgi:D-alanyl-D-alanine carboxypeptidase
MIAASIHDSLFQVQAVDRHFASLNPPHHLSQVRISYLQYTEMLTTGKVETPNGGRYAYGFQEASINGVNGTRCFGHGGGAPGMNGELKICPGPAYVVAVLANRDPPAATRVADFITNRLPIK